MTDAANGRLVLVTGATGQQGGAVARHLLRNGFLVRALTRDASQDAARTLSKKGAEIAEGNLNDADALRQALGGAWGVYSVQNFFEEGVAVETEQGQRLADLAQEAGVQHLVYSSVASADADTGIPHFESKWAVEKHLHSLGLPYTVLRPVAFMSNWQWSKEDWTQGALHQPLSPGTVLHQVDVDDVGRLAAQAFAEPEAWAGRTAELAGDARTMAEVAKALGRATGRAVRYEPVPWDAFEQQAGEELTLMYRWFEDKGYALDVEALRRKYPWLKDFDAYLRTAPFVRATA